jgi:hypothetical protein
MRRVPGLLAPMPAELRNFTERVVTCAVPKSQQFHAVKQSVWRYVARWFIGVTQCNCKRKGSARVESAVLWRSIDLMEVVSDHVLVTGTRISTPWSNETKFLPTQNYLEQTAVSVTN